MTIPRVEKGGPARPAAVYKPALTTDLLGGALGGCAVCSALTLARRITPGSLRITADAQTKEAPRSPVISLSRTRVRYPARAQSAFPRYKGHRR
jgi:hypothetical protein